MAVLLATACTGEDDPSAEQSRPPSSQTPPPRRGGSLVFGVVGEPATLDPYSPLAGDLTWALVRPVYPSLFRLLPDGTTEPYLAERLEAGERRARVTLRPLYWSNGRAVNSRDVVASVRRARSPSGFADLRARSVTPSIVELRGTPADWEQTLSTVAYVLPGGRAPRVPQVSAGPFQITGSTPGLQIRYRRNPVWGGPKPYLDGVTVQFVEFFEVLIALLDSGRIDAALTPSAVNLADRLDAIGIALESQLGWESVSLDLRGSDLDRDSRLALGRALDREAIAEGFVREDGRLADTLSPDPGDAGAEGPWPVRGRGSHTANETIRLSAPIGDELLELAERAFQAQLLDEGYDVELVNSAPGIYYGEWSRSRPTDAALVRRAGAPGWEQDALIRRLAAVPLFHVETAIAHDPAVHGIAVNPSIEGPLWNLEQWWIERPG